MSHTHERNEKICLNCGAALTGRYCPDCGQENVEPKESFWHLVGHFIEDVTHFDGKFFNSLKFLFTKPGFLTEEYINGRRVRYLNPIRMYLFISAMFFLIDISFFAKNTNFISESKKEKTDSTKKAIARNALHDIRVAMDSIDKSRLKIEDENNNSITFNDELLEKSVRAYDSIQNALPLIKRDNFLKHYYKRKFIASAELSNENMEEMQHRVREKIYHSLPYMLFFSFPLLALILKLIYMRRKQFWFVSHMIFVVHFFCMTFILFLFIDIAKQFEHGKMVQVLIFLGGWFYLYKSMRHFYKQRRAKTVIKFMLFGFIGSTIVGLMLALIVMNSFLNAAS